MDGVMERVIIFVLNMRFSLMMTFIFLVVPDGYGLSYSIGGDYIRWTITSLKRDTQVLKHYLAEAATELKHMLEAAEKKDKAEAKEKASKL